MSSVYGGYQRLIKLLLQEYENVWGYKNGEMYLSLVMYGITRMGKYTLYMFNVWDYENEECGDFQYQESVLQLGNTWDYRNSKMYLMFGGN